MIHNGLPVGGRRLRTRENGNGGLFSCCHQRFLLSIITINSIKSTKQTASQLIDMISYSQCIERISNIRQTLEYFIFTFRFLAG